MMLNSKKKTILIYEIFYFFSFSSSFDSYLNWNILAGLREKAKVTERVFLFFPSFFFLLFLGYVSVCVCLLYLLRKECSFIIIVDCPIF